MARINDETVNELLKLAHKLISPRSAMDTTSIEQTDGINVNHLAITFVRRILELAIPIMQHYSFSTLHQGHIAHALELFVKLDIEGHSHSYLLDDENSDESADSEWTMGVVEDDDDETLDDNHELPVDDSCRSDDEEEDVRTDVDNNTTTMFDASFEPIERDVKLSNLTFSSQVATEILQEQNLWGVSLEDAATGMLKMAMYSYVVAKLR